jgi:hypothetical protein
MEIINDTNVHINQIYHDDHNLLQVSTTAKKKKRKEHPIIMRFCIENILIFCFHQDDLYLSIYIDDHRRINFSYLT